VTTLKRDSYDVLVVGGGPAGSAGALLAARHGAAVLLVEQHAPPAPPGGCGWLGPAGVELCRELGVTAEAAGARPFAGLRLFSWDLARRVRLDDRELSGWLVERGRLDEALLDAARQAGADVRLGRKVTDIQLGEQQATLALDDGTQVGGQVVLVADGVSSPVGRQARLTPALSLPDLPRCAFVEYACEGGGDGLDVAIGADRRGRNLTIVRLGGRVRVSLTMHGSEREVADEFADFCRRAAEVELLPPLDQTPRVRFSPGGAALELDSHVGKRSLLIGDAGGFVAAFSNEGIYPAMRSGTIAAETALRSLAAPVMQDELATFGSAWRHELADYLRLPNTDLSLLIPLVFNNEQMSRRLARAFLLGQPF